MKYLAGLATGPALMLAVTTIIIIIIIIKIIEHRRIYFDDHDIVGLV